MDGDIQEKDNSSVQVAVRIRPLIHSEISRGCRDILEVFPAIQQIRIKDSDKAFSYNHVCDSDTSQDRFYNMCVKHMIDNLFKGYNMTILAYGQTGSGKTHSMGTTYNGHGEMGIIPRAINDIFNYVNHNFAYDFNITVSFMELYQEILYDLLAQKPRDQCIVEIREDLKGMIIPGLTEESVNSANRTLELLTKGSLGRATGSTNMNSQSSRSYAVFTINICMQRKDNSNLNKMAKFQLVDLAGSEICNKIGATGVDFQECCKINKDFLALNKVISALGDEKQPGFINYRDSNLTRLLQDSLGGNSITLMIACVSPADCNLEETISTLRYADRAQNIKNKPVVNQDPKGTEINTLNKLDQRLRLELVGQDLQTSSTLKEHIKKLLDFKEECNITINNLNLNIEQNNPDAIKDHISKLHTMQDIFSDIVTEGQKAEDEICSSTTSVANSELSAELELSERQENHTKQQMALNTQLQEVTKMPALKEHLTQQMQANTNYMVDYKAIAENEDKVTCLEKRVRQLEKEIHELHRKTNQKLTKQEATHEYELSNVARDYEERISVLLRQLEELKCKNQELEERCTIQQEEIVHLQKTLDDIKFEQPNQPKTPEKIIEKPDTKKKKTLIKIISEDTDYLETTFEDDINADPDWTARPIKHKKLKRSPVAPVREDRLTVKRNLDGSCFCTGNCSTRCGCYKLSQACGSLCKCKAELCTNKENDTEEQPSTSRES